jgi:hypothetical protein
MRAAVHRHQLATVVGCCPPRALFAGYKSSAGALISVLALLIAGCCRTKVCACELSQASELPLCLGLFVLLCF